MAVTVVGSASIASEGTNGTAHGPLTLPTVQNDDWIVIGGALASGTTMTATGIGMTAEAGTINTRSGFGLNVWVKKLTSAHSGATINFTTGSSLKTAVTATIFRGIDPTATPTVPTPVNNTALSTMPGPSFTPAVSKVLVHVIGMATAASAPPDPSTGWTPPSGMTRNTAQTMGGTTGRAGVAIGSQLTENTGIGTGWAATINNSWGITAVEFAVATVPTTPSVQAYVKSGVAAFNWQNRTTADTLYSPAPTVSTALGQTTTISGGALVAPDDSRFRYRGGSGFAYGSSFPDTLCYQPSSRYPGGWGNPAVFGVRFLHTGTTFELLYKWLSAAGAGWLRITVDGQRLTDQMYDIPGTTGGSMHTTKVVFGSSATREILVEVQGVPFGGVYVGSGNTITQAPAFERRVIVQGDSTSAGSDGNTGSSAGTWVGRWARYAGTHVDVWNQAIGATGFTAPGTAVTIPDRLADVTSHAPNDVILWCGGNDGSTSIVTEATTWINNVKSAVPGVRVIVVGTWSPTVSPSSARAARSSDLQSAALATGCPFISPISGNVYNAAGQLIATQTPWIATSGDVTAYVYTGDNVHPTDAGHEMIAKRMADAMAAIAEIPVTPYLKTSGGQTQLTIEIGD